MNFSNVPSLKEISAFKVALEIWYKGFYADNYRSASNISYQPESLTQKYADDANELIDTMASEIPCTLLGTLKTQILIITEEIRNFMWHYHERVSDVEYNELHIIKVFPGIVWNNRTIDYKQTAISLISGNEVSKSEKFKLMCNCCLKDDIMAVAIFEGITIDVDEKNYPMVQYWIDVLNGDEPEELYEIGLISEDETAINYLWDDLPLPDQLLRAQACASPNTLIRWMAKLAKKDLRQLCSAKITAITEIFLSHWAYDSFIRSMWSLVKDFLTGEQYVHILHLIRRSSNESVAGCSGTIGLLTHIWEDTPHKLKKFAFDFRHGYIIHDICSFLMLDNPDRDDIDNSAVKERRKDAILLAAILPDMDADFKKNFLSNKFTRTELNFDF